MTGNRPGDFTKWLTKAREQMGSNIPLQVAQDVLLEAEQAIRNLGDCGGGRSLALFIMAIADDGRRFRVSDLSTLDVGMSSLAARLFHEFMVGKRDHDEWQSLAELAQRVVFPDDNLSWQKVFET